MEQKSESLNISKVLSLKEIVSRLDTLVKMALEAEDKPLKEGVSFAQVYKQLMDVQKTINFLAEDQKEVLRLMSSVPGALPLQEKPDMSKEDKKLYTKLREMEKVCAEAQSRVHASIQEQEGAKEIIQDELSLHSGSHKKKMAHRKGKFKKMGGSGGWVRS